MRVVFAVDSMNSGGTEKVVSILANYFVSKLDIETYILMVSASNCFSFYELDKRVTLIAELEGKKKKYFERVADLRAKIISINPDAVVAMLPHVIAYIYLALKKTGIPLIVSERNNPYKHNLLYKMINKYVFKKADYCVFQTNGAADFYKISKEKYKIIYNPCSIDFNANFNFKTIEGFAATGRLVKQKNYFFMIDCFKQFVSKHPKFYLNIYGGGPLRKKINKYIIKNSLQKNVFLKGRDLQWLQKEASKSCFIMTSLFEGMPNSLIEALSAGMPAVVTDCQPGGPREIINLFNRGRLSSFDKNEFIKNMESSLLDDHAINKEAASKFLPSTICEEWHKVILKVLRK